jgi:hypothetical protein
MYNARALLRTRVVISESSQSIQYYFVSSFSFGFHAAMEKHHHAHKKVQVLQSSASALTITMTPRPSAKPFPAVAILLVALVIVLVIATLFYHGLDKKQTPLYIFYPLSQPDETMMDVDQIIRSRSTITTLLTTGAMASPNVSSSTVWLGWSFCNQANEPESYTRALHLPSPRRAICPLVTEQDNLLTFPRPIPGLLTQPKTPDEYARAKEVYLSHQCNDSVWAVMFKSGNMDRNHVMDLCPATESTLSAPFNDLPMNQPLMVQMSEIVLHDSSNLNPVSYFAGTYDVDLTWDSHQIHTVQEALHQYTQAWMRYYYDDENDNSQPTPPTLLQNSSFLYTAWTQTPSHGLVYSSMVYTSLNYPWLMNYLRSNDHVTSHGPEGYGGYPWKGAGNVMGPVAAIPGHKLVMTIRLAIFAQPKFLRGLFYMPEFSACWKRSDGSPCDPGDTNLEENLTRYLCFSVSTVASSPCQATSPQACPPWHFSFQLQEWISARNRTHYPYECYHLYCGPYNNHGCDPYSNPIPQELVQVKTCKEWGHFGFPTKPLPTGKDADVQTWTLNVGALGNAVYFYDAKHNDGKIAPISKDLPLRTWISFDVGPEVGVGSPRNPADAITETRWEVSEWDLQLIKDEEVVRTDQIENYWERSTE